MRSDHLKNHMKRHDKHVEMEPLSSIPPTSSMQETSASTFSFNLQTNMDKEVLLKKMLKCDREFKEKLEMGEQMYEFIKEYDIDEKSIPKEVREPLEIYKEQKHRRNCCVSRS